MSKQLYIYDQVDVCDPGSSSYHESGGLVVITDGDPNDAVKAGTGSEISAKTRQKVEQGSRGYHFITSDGYVSDHVMDVDDHVITALPVPSRVIDVPDATPNAVHIFPNSGCC